jgi:hypothetical protein
MKNRRVVTKPVVGVFDLASNVSEGWSVVILLIEYF